MLVIFIVLGMIALLVIMELYDYRSRKKNLRVSKNKHLNDEYERSQKVLNSMVDHRDENDQKIKNMERDISDLENNEKYFSNL